jgi:hypothetical protein
MSLDRYRLLAQLGAGPDGIAYRAFAEDGLTLVNVVELGRARSDDDRWGQLVPRLRMAHELDHRFAIQVVELGLTGEPPYAVLEWAGTETLAEAVAKGGPKTRGEAIALVREVASA